MWTATDCVDCPFHLQTDPGRRPSAAALAAHPLVADARLPQQLPAAVAAAAAAQAAAAQADAAEAAQPAQAVSRQPEVGLLSSALQERLFVQPRFAIL